jgi:hypothetical protein
MLRLRCPKRRCPVQEQVNRRTDMNEPDSASFSPTLCSPEAQSQTAADRVGLKKKMLSKLTNTMKRKGLTKSIWRRKFNIIKIICDCIL